MTICARGNYYKPSGGFLPSGFAYWKFNRSARKFWVMDIIEVLTRTEEMWSRSKRDRGNSHSAQQEAGPRLKISIIIPAHNEQAYLKRTLIALRHQNYPEYEVVVVANGCTDDTAAVAREHCDRLIILSQKSLGIARNLGARMAQGELLVFLDADTILERDALATIAACFSSSHAAGTLKGVPHPVRPAYQLIYFMKNFTHRFHLHHGSAGVIICWKKHFIQLGGFDERLEMRENSELIYRLERFGNYRFVSETAAITSMRRYERCGVWRIVWLWTKLWCESHFRDLRDRKYEIVR
jgi:glycosyltransferase involved in cell wall biosynthesis